MHKSGFNHIITMDLHQKEIQGYFECPVDNLRASPFLLRYIQESVRVVFCPTVFKGSVHTWKKSVKYIWDMENNNYY